MKGIDALLVAAHDQQIAHLLRLVYELANGCYGGVLRGISQQKGVVGHGDLRVVVVVVLDGVDDLKDAAFSNEVPRSQAMLDECRVRRVVLHSFQ